MIDTGKRDVLGVGVNVIDCEAAVERIVTAALQKCPLSVTSLAVHGVITGVLDPEQKYRLNRFGLVTPDGQPVRWALRLLHGESLPDRVCGRDLSHATCARAADLDLSIYLYGSRSEVLDAWKARLRQQFPKLRIAGAEPSKFRKLSIVEAEKLDERIRASEADIVFVGLGCPRQEVFAYEHADGVSRPVLAIGAAFDFHAGLLPEAPRWMQKSGLEWAFRLLMEPRRLWRRYLYFNSLYCLMIAGQRLGLMGRRLSKEREPTGTVRHG